MFYILLYLSLWRMTSRHSSSAINGKSMHGLLLRFCILSLQRYSFLSNLLVLQAVSVQHLQCYFPSMAAASFKESGSDHMWTVLFFFHGVVQRHLITYSCKCIKPDCVFIHFLFNGVGITDLVILIANICK